MKPAYAAEGETALNVHLVLSEPPKVPEIRAALGAVPLGKPLSSRRCDEPSRRWAS